MRLVLFSALILAGFASASLARAEGDAAISCSTVNLRNDPRMPPVRAQGDLSWCYASVAADMISFAYTGGAPVSFLDLGIQYERAVYDKQLKTKHDDFGSLDQNGDEVNALLLAQRNGACLEKDISPTARKIAESFLQRTKPADADKVWQAEVDRVPGAPAYLTKLFQEIQDLEPTSPTATDAVLCKDLQVVNEIFPNIDVPSLKQALLIAQNAPDDFVPALTQFNCQDPVTVPKTAQIVHDQLGQKGTSADSLLREIDGQLNSHNLSSIDYYFHLRDLSQVGQQTGGHISIVAGRRFDAKSGQCEYLIKDSHGTDCAQYDPSLRPDCDAGYIWVPQKILQQDIRGTTHLSSQP